VSVRERKRGSGARCLLLLYLMIPAVISFNAWTQNVGDLFFGLRALVVCSLALFLAWYWVAAFIRLLELEGDDRNTE